MCNLSPLISQQWVLAPRVVDNNNIHVLSSSNGAKQRAYIISFSAHNSPMRDIRSNHMELLIL